MDALELAAIARAKSAIEVAWSGAGGDDIRTHAKAFAEVAFMIANARKGVDIGELMASSSNPIVQKAAAHVLGDAVWVAPEAAALAAAYVQSIADGSLIDTILPNAIGLSRNLAHVIFASGFTANTVAEGGVKVIRRVPEALASAEVSKATSIVVMSRELANIPGAQRLFERELRESVSRAMNGAVLNSLLSTSTTEIATTGDALGDLRAGLHASVPSTAYVVAVSTKNVNDLATRAENKGGAGVRGGTFVPGVELVVVDEFIGLAVIPASHIAIEDGGLRVVSAGHASVNMADSPTSPSTQVSLFQTNSIGLLAERQFRIATDANIVVVGGA